VVSVTHPARFSKSILAEIGSLVDAEVRRRNRTLRLLDPFAGVGKVHRLCDGDLPGQLTLFGFAAAGVETVGVEFEPEWASQHPRTMVGDARSLPFAAASFDVVVTSPTYGNRMADHHNAKDGSRRVTYRHTLGRPLTPGNSGSMQWGEKYRQLHQRSWSEVRRVLTHDELFVLNVSNHIRAGEEVPVVEWHLETLLGKGFRLEADIPVHTGRMRFGENHASRVDCEHVMCLRR
jgi:hypothetical protein